MALAMVWLSLAQGNVSTAELVMARCGAGASTGVGRWKRDWTGHVLHKGVLPAAQVRLFWIHRAGQLTRPFRQGHMF